MEMREETTKDTRQRLLTYKIKIYVWKKNRTVIYLRYHFVNEKKEKEKAVHYESMARKINLD